MDSKTSNRRIPDWLPFVLPFAAFMVATQIESIGPLRAHYPWAYTAKVVLVSALCLFFIPKWPKFSSRGLLSAVAFGVVGVVLWVGLVQLGIEDWLRNNVPVFGQIVQQRIGYNPFDAIPSPVGRTIFLAVRFFGLALLVPLIEELFWRGFLIRFLISEKFSEVPIGACTPFSFAVVTLFFALVHPEILAAVVWGAGINLLWAWSKNLWACVIAHAVTNLLLGLYVVRSGEWYLW